MITTTHRVEITVPEQQAPGYFTMWYAGEISRLKNGYHCIESGSHFRDGNVTEWAHFENLSDAELFEDALSQFLGCDDSPA